MICIRGSPSLVGDVVMFFFLSHEAVVEKELYDVVDGVLGFP